MKARLLFSEGSRGKFVLAFSSFYRPPAFLGSRPLLPSSEPAGEQFLSSLTSSIITGEWVIGIITGKNSRKSSKQCHASGRFIKKKRNSALSKWRESEQGQRRATAQKNKEA